MMPTNPFALNRASLFRAFSFVIAVSFAIVPQTHQMLAQEAQGTSKPIVKGADNAETGKNLIGAKELSAAFKSAASKTLPCVVLVLAKRGNSDDKLDILDSLDFLDDEASKDYNIGSGVIISSRGLIVTNHHVVANTKRVRVRLPDGREFQASDIRSDANSDLAILKVESSKPLDEIKIGNSSDLEVGDWILAIGSPFAIEQTVSAGIISGKSRNVRGLVSGQLLQTDAAINPGNSGGAMVNLDGELVGINTAIASTSGVFQGVGFAIPSNRVRWITSELEKHNKVRRATMGVATVALPQEIAEQLELPIRGGVLVIRVREGMPADKAGIKKGDVILKIADQSVHSPLDFAAIVEQLPIDQSQKIELMREGTKVELQVSLQPKPE